MRRIVASPDLEPGILGKVFEVGVALRGGKRGKLNIGGLPAIFSVNVDRNTVLFQSAGGR